MNIFSVAALGITGALTAVLIKGIKPEMSILVSLAVGAVLLSYCAKNLEEIFLQFSAIAEKSGINVKYFHIALKACIIAYITQFASELCKDAGEGAIAVKTEFAGKISIAGLSMPVISGFLNAVSELLDRV